MEESAGEVDIIGIVVSLVSSDKHRSYKSCSIYAFIVASYTPQEVCQNLVDLQNLETSKSLPKKLVQASKGFLKFTHGFCWNECLFFEHLTTLSVAPAATWSQYWRHSCWFRSKSCIASSCIWANMLRCQFVGFVSLLHIQFYDSYEFNFMRTTPYTSLLLPAYLPTSVSGSPCITQNKMIIWSYNANVTEMYKTFSYNLGGPFGFTPCGVMEDVDVHSVHW